MTRSPHHGRSAGPTRRSFGRLAALALGAGVGTLSLASGATAAAVDGRTYYDRARQLAGDDPVLLALVTALTPDFVFPR
ncbi:MBL fold metallo-hydrolase, partial [Streptomyces sp. 8K308]